jgi:hypothetical protein
MGLVAMLDLDSYEPIPCIIYRLSLVTLFVNTLCGIVGTQ